MTTGPDEVSQGFSQGHDDGTGINPAWNELLEFIPEDKYNDATQVLRKYDSNFNQKLGEVQSKYQDYEPFAEAEIKGDEIEFALGLLNAINEQPQEVLAALNQYIASEDGDEEVEPQGGGSSNSGNDDQGLPEGFDLTQHPEFQRYSGMVEQMAELLANDRQEALDAEEEEELEAELEELREQHGDFDEDYIVSKLFAGKTGEEAIQEYNEFLEKHNAKPNRPAPRVLGAGSSIPSNRPDVTKLDDKGTRSLVAQALQQAIDAAND